LEIFLKINTVGIMSPGTMGQAFARQFQQAGLHVVTALHGRSARTRTLAADAGIIDVGSLTRLATDCDVILSIMNPGSALAFANELAVTIQTTKHSPLFVDCNAISPDTMRAIDERITAAGGRCADAGILGPPPTAMVKSRWFVSGPEARVLEQLATPQLSVQVMSERIGDASALKICDAVMAKGLTAMMLQMLVVARRYGIEDALDAQCEGPRRYFHDWILRTLPIMPPKAYRWVPEMEQIAQTFEAVGVSGDMMRAATQVYEQVAQTALGQEAPEDRDLSLDGQDVARLLTAAMRG
jgi:3-hydroxyisobutyrate dehydrogenase-like beta-hydroxyacid dehydrogenase